MSAEDLRLSLSPTQLEFVKTDANVAHLVGPMGEGKCLGKGTPILMHAGRIKNVEDVRVGDQLMGDDSTPRNVLSLGTGIGPLYRVTPIKGDPFVCNSEHILSLKRTGEKNTRRGKKTKTNFKGITEDIQIMEYIGKSDTYKNTRKLFRVPVAFTPAPVNIDPYFLGLWLGDGSSHNTGITTSDQEIVKYLHHYGEILDLHISTHHHQNNQSNTYILTKGNKGKPENILYQWLQQYGLLYNKHIPTLYKANSRFVRGALLAGLIDSNGYLNRTSYQWTLKSQTLATDILYLCRSLGFAAYSTQVKKSIKEKGFTGEYYQVGVSGDLSEVPVLLKRKQSSHRRQKKDVLVTAIKAVSPLGIGRYFGFNIDGNHRFLLGDFTVTHNTHAGCAAMIYHAKRCNINLHAAIIRDTHENIKTSTAVSIREVLGDGWIRFKDNYKKLIIKTRPSVEVDLFGIDDQASLSKLQGPQYGLIWLEEPAPIHEKSNSGLPYEVFTMALARCGRQAGSKPRLQITQNPGDDEHWTSQLMEDPEEMQFPMPDGSIIVITKKTFHIPPGENKYLTPQQRAMNMAAFKNDPGKWARYVEGKRAEVQIGAPVTGGYGPTVHFSQKILPVYPNLTGFRGWDGYQHPACVTGQYTPTGQFVIHDVLYKAGIGTEDLIEDMLYPLLAMPKYDEKIVSWREIGDPSMKTPDQSSIKRSAAKVIQTMLGTRFESGPTRWNNRIEPVNHALKRFLDGGRPSIILSASAVALHRALKGGWRYKTNNSGNRIGKEDVKNEHSHPGNAFAYLISRIMPHDVRGEIKKTEKETKMQRALSYGGGGQYQRIDPGHTIGRRIFG